MTLFRSAGKAAWLSPSGEVHPLGQNEGHLVWVEKHRNEIHPSLHHPDAEEMANRMLRSGWVRQAGPDAYHVGRERDVARVRDHVLMNYPQVKQAVVDLPGYRSRVLDIHEATDDEVERRLGLGKYARKRSPGEQAQQDQFMRDFLAPSSRVPHPPEPPRRPSKQPFKLTIWRTKLGKKGGVLEQLDGLAAARAATHPSPSAAQKAAGNYPKGKVQLHGLTIAIENPKGSMRSGTSKAGVTWTQKMVHDYGYILGTVGKDKDHLDAFVGPHHESELVHVIDQYRPDTGAFDEHKVVFGARSTHEAKDIYHANYAKGWKGLGHITPMHISEFKAWLRHHNTRSPMHAQRREPRDTFRAVREAIAAVATGVAPADVVEAGWDDAIYLRGRHGAWLSPRGNFHPLQRGQLHKDWVHANAKTLGVKVPKRPGRKAPGMGDTTDVEHELLHSGWVKKSDATTYEAHSADPRVLRNIRQHMREYHPDESHFSLQVGKVGAGATGHYLPVWEDTVDEGDVIRPPASWWNDPVRVKLPIKAPVVPISQGVAGRTPRPRPQPIDAVAFEKGMSKLRGVRAQLDQEELTHRSKLPCPKCGGPTHFLGTYMERGKDGTSHACKDGWCGHKFDKPF